MSARLHLSFSTQTDRDCCAVSGPSKMQTLFVGWPDLLHIRLDVWHFMRRLAQGVTTESHPLYGRFMAAVSNAVFEWDDSDYKAHLHAKHQQLLQAGVRNQTESAVRKAITREEAARHCRRRTWDVTVIWGTCWRACSCNSLLRRTLLAFPCSKTR